MQKAWKDTTIEMTWRETSNNEIKKGRLPKTEIFSYKEIVA